MTRGKKRKKEGRVPRQRECVLRVRVRECVVESRPAATGGKEQRRDGDYEVTETEREMVSSVTRSRETRGERSGGGGRTPRLIFALYLSAVVVFILLSPLAKFWSKRR